MQYIHVALALHSAGKKVTLTNIKKMLDAVGAKSDDAQIKALVAVLEDVNIDEAVKSAPVLASTSVQAPTTEPTASPSKPKEKEPKEPEEDLGLDNLFG